MAPSCVGRAVRKRLIIVGQSNEALELIPALEANPDVQVEALVVTDAHATRATLEADPATAGLCDRVSEDLETALAIPGLTGVIDADAPSRHRDRFDEVAELQITTPALARLLYAFGPIDAFTKGDLLNALREILDSYDLGLERGALFHRVLQIAIAAAGADRGSLMLWDETERSLRVEVAVGIEAELVPTIRRRSGEGISGHVFSVGRPLLLQGKVDRERYEIVREREDVTSAISAPLRHRDRVIGVLNLSHGREGDAFDDEDLDFVEQLARLDARLIARAEEFHRLRRESETLRAEAQVHRVLTSESALSDRLRALCRDLAKETDGIARLYLHEPAFSALVLQATSQSANPFGPRERVRLGEGVIGKAAQTRREVILRAQIDDTQLAHTVIPLMRDQTLVGVVSLEGVGADERELERARASVAALSENLRDQLRGAQLERGSKRQAQLTDIVARLGVCADADAAERLLAEEAATLLEAQDAVVRLRDPSTGRFRIVAWSGVGAWREATLAGLEKQLAVECIRERKTLRVAELGAELGEQSAIGAAMVMPMLQNGSAVGSLSVMGKVPEEPVLGEVFDTEDENLLSMLAAHFLASRSGGEVVASLGTAAGSRYDGETGLPGSEMLRERLDQEIARSGMRGHELVLFRFDVPSLAESETEDETASDAATRIGQALRTALRDFDVVARDSVSRFSALIPEPDAELPALVATLGRALNDALEAFEISGSEMQMGYAVYPSDGQDAETLLQKVAVARVESH